MAKCQRARCLYTCHSEARKCQCMSLRGIDNSRLQGPDRSHQSLSLGQARSDMCNDTWKHFGHGMASNHCLSCDDHPRRKSCSMLSCHVRFG